ncbi:MAG: Smr/MutS family protein [Candidatus Neomarinimicrobiota bacterium]
MKLNTKFKILDIGHRGFSLDYAISTLEVEVSNAVHGNKIKAIKVIHGHGRGALKAGVRDWCESQKGRFQAIIKGEDYDIFHSETVAMRTECNSPYDPDLGRKNGAVTYIWLW